MWKMPLCLPNNYDFKKWNGLRSELRMLFSSHEWRRTEDAFNIKKCIRCHAQSRQEVWT